MKILVVCQHYWPQPFPSTDICEGLVQRGHEVHVITDVPNYPMGYIYPEYKEVFDDTEFFTVYYGEDVSKETADGLLDFLEEEYPDIEFSMKKGGQPLYYYILSAE